MALRAVYAIAFAALETGDRESAMPVLGQVTPRLPVNDLRGTIAFYTERLGFGVDVLWPDQRPTFVILCRDSTTLGFFELAEGRPGPIGYAELYIEVDDAAALHRSLADRVSMEWGPEVYSYGRREFAVRDPDGYLVIFTESTNEAPTTIEPDDRDRPDD